MYQRASLNEPRPRESILTQKNIGKKVDFFGPATIQFTPVWMRKARSCSFSATEEACESPRAPRGRVGWANPSTIWWQVTSALTSQQTIEFSDPQCQCDQCPFFGVASIMNPIAILAALFVGWPCGDGISKAKPVPKVELLPAYPNGERILKDMPVPVKGSIYVAYKCSSVDPLKEANLRYRVVPAGHELKAKPIPWRVQRLEEKKGMPELGKFDIDRGVFEKCGPNDQVPFHAVGDEKRRCIGGGCLVFPLKADAKPGDRIEFFIEVFDDTQTVPGHSGICVREVVTLAEFLEWVRRNRDEEQRIRELEKKQKDVSPKKSPPN
jgi:hypothetical protein